MQINRVRFMFHLFVIPFSPVSYIVALFSYLCVYVCESPFFVLLVYIQLCRTCIRLKINKFVKMVGRSGNINDKNLFFQKYCKNIDKFVIYKCRNVTKYSDFIFTKQAMLIFFFIVAISQYCNLSISKTVLFYFSVRVKSSKLLSI